MIIINKINKKQNQTAEYSTHTLAGIICPHPFFTMVLPDWYLSSVCKKAFPSANFPIDPSVCPRQAENLKQSDLWTNFIQRPELETLSTTTFPHKKILEKQQRIYQQVHKSD